MTKKIIPTVLLIALAGVALLAQTTSESLWKIDFSTDETTSGVQLSKNFCWDIDDHLTLFSTDSTIKISFHLPDGDYSKCKLKITDRASVQDIQKDIFSMAGVEPEDSEEYALMINVNVNDKEAIYNNNVYWDTDMTHTYNLRGFVRDDFNTITFVINPNSLVRYEIKSIELMTN